MTKEYPLTNNPELNAAIKRLSGFEISPYLIWGFIDRIQEVTGRSYANIANSLKVLFTRLGRRSVQRELFGIVGNDSNFEGMLKYICNQWVSLSPQDKNKVAELVGGIYHINNVKALFGK